MTADIHDFLGARPVYQPTFNDSEVLTAFGYATAYAPQAAGQTQPKPKPPLGYHQLRYCDTVYGPRRDHPSCLPGTVTPPAETLNRNPQGTASRFDVEWET